MFTGIVQALGSVAVIEETPTGMSIFVEPPEATRTGLAPEWQRPFEDGESICVNGCCLTLARTIPRHHRGGPPTSLQPHAHLSGPDVILAFDVIHETLSKTTIGRLSPGAHVNLERSATLQTFLGGHIVQGHVDGLGSATKVQTGDDWRIRIKPLVPELMQYLAPKGSVTVDGVSLTVAALGPDWFEVALIPTTLAKTTLRDIKEGDSVNLEMDSIAKTVVHWLRNFGGGRAMGAGDAPR